MSGASEAEVGEVRALSFGRKGQGQGTVDRAWSAAGSGWVQRGGKGRRLLQALSKLIATGEALSMTLANGECRVVGNVYGDPRNGVVLEAGWDVLYLADKDINWVEERDGAVIAHGNFRGGQVSWRLYEKRMTRGREAASKVDGDAWWLCDIIDRMGQQLERGECMSVRLSSPDEGPFKLQWHEFDRNNGEVVLLAGRLDRLRQVRLRADRLGEAETSTDEVQAESFRGRMVTIAIELEADVVRSQDMGSGVESKI